MRVLQCAGGFSWRPAGLGVVIVDLFQVFGESRRMRVSEVFLMVLKEGCEDFLSPTVLFDSSGLDLFGI